MILEVLLIEVTHLISIHGRELVHPRVDEETFEARDSELNHLPQVRSVTGDHPSPELDIDPALALCSLNFNPD